jgi:heme oxygenase
MVKLKKVTNTHHSEISSLPFFKALIDHRLPLECYVYQLRALAIIFRILEQKIFASENNLVKSIRDEDKKKLPLLSKDLQFFSNRLVFDYALSLDIANSITDNINRREEENPASILGYLYVYEGTTLGNSMHSKDVAATYLLDKLNGYNYYACYLGEVQQQWSRFSQKMQNVLVDQFLHVDIIQTAHEAFSELKILYQSLYPIEIEYKKYKVNRINPEAGSVAIPDNEEEIQAALRTSDRCWSEFPYFKYRFGERGKRFSNSDICWLVTLTKLDQKNLNNQVEWVGRLLSFRGMPQYILEITLRFLYEELIKTQPHKKNNYDKLLKSADMLKTARIKIISDEKFNALVDKFDQMIGKQEATTYKNTGKILVSSVCDEKNGIENAVPKVLDWLLNKSQFSEKWILTVKRIIKMSRQAALKNG